MTSQTRLGRAAFAAAGVLVFCAPAVADSIEFSEVTGTELSGLGHFSGVISYEASALSTTGTLTIMLTNTCEEAGGGVISAFLFNIGSVDANASATLLQFQSHPFSQITGEGLTDGTFGQTFDAGAAIPADFRHVGDAGEGVGAGETGVVTFQVDAIDAGELTAMSFLAGGDGDFDFLVQFSGFSDGGRDVVPGAIMVPLPPPVTLSAVGLLGVIILSRHFRRLRHVVPTGDQGRVAYESL